VLRGGRIRRRDVRGHADRLEPVARDNLDTRLDGSARRNRFGGPVIWTTRTAAFTTSARQALCSRCRARGTNSNTAGCWACAVRCSRITTRFPATVAAAGSLRRPMFLSILSSAASKRGNRMELCSVHIEPTEPKISRPPRRSGDPGAPARRLPWIPAWAGMTTWVCDSI
jgi:hypothetical protein